MTGSCVSCDIVVVVVVAVCICFVVVVVVACSCHCCGYCRSSWCSVTTKRKHIKMWWKKHTSSPGTILTQTFGTICLSLQHVFSLLFPGIKEGNVVQHAEEAAWPSPYCIVIRRGHAQATVAFSCLVFRARRLLLYIPRLPSGDAPLPEVGKVLRPCGGP